MSILITGGAGFIGAALAERLNSEGHDVRVLDSLSTQVHGEDPTMSPTLQLAQKNAEVVRGSVTTRSDLEEALGGVEVVVHLAAETGTGQSMYQIERYTHTNVGGTALLLDVLRNTHHDVRKVIVASSRSVYGEGKYHAEGLGDVYPGPRKDEDLRRGHYDPTICDYDGQLTLRATDEESRIRPSSIYAITKHTQEQLVMTACASMGISAVALRFQNVYGPGQSPNNPYTGILSIFSKQILTGERINIFEDGKESRDFVFIDDVVEAASRTIDASDADGQVVNVGSGVATSILEVVSSLFSAFGKKVPVDITGVYRLGDIRHNYADISKLRRLLGSQPKVDFSSGSKLFADWVTTQQLASNQYLHSLEELRARHLLR